MNPISIYDYRGISRPDLFSEKYTILDKTYREFFRFWHSSFSEQLKRWLVIITRDGVSDTLLKKSPAQLFS